MGLAIFACSSPSHHLIFSSGVPAGSFPFPGVRLAVLLSASESHRSNLRFS